MEAPASDHRTSVVTVSYWSGDPLRHMLGSLPPGTKTVIVNNAPEDALECLDGFDSPGPVTLINNAENTGFGAACNRGAQQVDSEFILFLNPDAVLTPGSMEALEEAADSFPNAVAFNPAMTDARGRPLFKRGSVLLPRRARRPRGGPSETTTVPVLNGAALFVRKSAFDAVGGFDERIFLYHEDDDLSLRLAEEVGDLMFVRQAQVTHQGGHSTARTPETAAFKAYHMGQSRVYAACKHRVPLARSRALLSALLQMLSPATFLSKRKRAKHRAFLTGVSTAIFKGTER